VADRFDTPNGALVFSQAGTAISKRYKGERNSFNVIEVDRPRVRVRKYWWEAGESAYAAHDEGVVEFEMRKHDII
jgi:hypothetical protein